jgi:hypothetical protein
MCYLPEWDIVNNNNKYTQNINGDINGMLTKFISPYNDYIFRILTLLDYLDVSKEYDTEDHGKTVHMICRETRDVRRINSSWRMNIASIIEFLNSNNEPSRR